MVTNENPESGDGIRSAYNSTELEVEDSERLFRVKLLMEKEEVGVPVPTTVLSKRRAYASKLVDADPVMFSQRILLKETELKSVIALTYIART